MKAKIFLVALMIGTCISCTKTETDMFGRIHGIVTDAETGEPIQTASVTLTPGGKTTTTGSDGRYDYGDLSAGEYTVQIAKTGYQTNTKRVNVEPGVTSQGDILLYYGSGSLKVNKSTIEFGQSDNVAVFEITNNGQSDLEWSIAENCDWITSVSPSSGSIKNSQKAAVTVNISRSGLPAGQKQTYTLIVTSNGGSAEITISVNGSESSGGGNGSVVTAGLLAYYTFDDGTADDATDNDIDGNLLNEPEFIDNIPGGTGKALSLNATKGQYFTIPNNPISNVNEFSFSFWVKDAGGAGQIMSGIGNATYYSQPYLYIEDSKVGIMIGNGYKILNYGASPLQDGTWRMVTFTYNDRTVMLYVDARKVAETTTNSYGKNQSSEIHFGGNGGFSERTTLSIKLDNIRIYNRVLTASDISKIYAGEKQ